MSLDYEEVIPMYLPVQLQHKEYNLQLYLLSQNEGINSGYLRIKNCLNVGKL